jgi:2-dehydropantoate 2-reductase
VNVYVVGAGAVGRYLGGQLSGSGNNVTYAPRDLEAVVPVAADLALVTVKAYDTPGAIATLERALADAPGATIVTPQNGVGNEELLAAAFGADRVVACALTVPVETGRDGTSVAVKGGGIAFAPVGAASPYNWLLATFEAAGLAATAAADYRSLKWSKLALNIVANASCAILNVLPERLVHMGDAFELEIRAIREVRAVMRAAGIPAIDLPRYPVRALQSVAALPAPVARALLANRIAGARGRKPPSLLLDLRAMKNRTEVDVLNGAVARAARANGLRAPVNTVLARIVSDIAQMPQLWAKYRERPDALGAEVDAEIARTAHGGSYATSQRP